MKIDELNLSVRSWHCLMRNGIDTVEKLRETSIEDLFKLRGMGTKSVNEITEKLLAMQPTAGTSEMQLIDMRTMWDCPTCSHNVPKGCKMFCDVGESYRPDASKLKIVDPESLRPKGQWVMDKLEIGNPYDANSTMVVDIGSCSCCDYRCEMLPIMNYCPNCGADMREG